MRMNQPQTSKSTGTTAKSTDLGNHQMGSITHHHIANRPFPTQQNTHLTPKVARNPSQVSSQLYRHHLVGRHLATISSLQSSKLGSLYSTDVSVNLRNNAPSASLAPSPGGYDCHYRERWRPHQSERVDETGFLALLQFHLAQTQYRIFSTNCQHSRLKMESDQASSNSNELGL